MSRQLFLSLFLLLATSVNGMAATYYIDYEGGSDKASGTSAKKAWQHCPTDAQATDKAAACTLSPGDVVIFKGGVRYRGKISKAVTGAAGKPVIYDGNTAGSFGEGVAIIDGSDALTSWKQCKNKDEAGGNPHFKEIWYTDIPHKGGWRNLNLLGPEIPMAVAQHPNPKDQMYQEAMGTYLRAKLPIKREKEGMSITDPDNLKGFADDYFNDMALCFHGGHNAACYLKVTDFDAASHTLKTTLYVNKTFKNKTYKDGTKYCFFNSVKIIDQPGEYAMQRIDEEKVRVFTWPPSLQDGQPQDISRSSKNRGFDIQKSKHVLVRGFKIERQGGSKAYGVYINGSKDVHFHQCEISQVRGSAGYRSDKCENLSVVDCYVHHLPGHTFGVFMRNGKNCEVIRTKIHKPTATAFDFYTVKGGKVSECVVTGFTGMHANGLTFYLGNEDIIIERNLVYGGNIPLTIKQAGNITIKNNILIAARSNMSIGMWSTMKHEGSYWKGPILQNVKIINNILINGNPNSKKKGGLYSNMQTQPQNLVVKNNIIGSVAGRLNGDYSHNIYTTKVAKGFMGEGCQVVGDMKKLFVDSENGDYTPAKGSPAVNAAIGPQEPVGIAAAKSQ